MDVKTIVFDLGGVFFTSGTSLAVEQIKEYLGLGRRDRKLEQEVNRIFIGAHRDIGHDYRNGDLTHDEFWSEVERRLGIDPAQARALEEIWHASYVPNEGMPELVRGLKQTGKYHLFIFSGNIKERIEYLDEEYQLLDLFDGWVMSYDHHANKDELRFYEILLEEIPDPPENTVLVDDNPRYCRIANGLGVHGLVFKGAAALREELTRLGVEFRN
ncbi:MAG: HAD family hydrolase [Promethearchaeota archaeon]